MYLPCPSAHSDHFHIMGGETDGGESEVSWVVSQKYPACRRCVMQLGVRIVIKSGAGSVNSNTDS